MLTKTVAQVVLRWNVQRGVTVIPKSTRQERIEENFAIWDFSLTESEMAQISSLDLGYVGDAVKHFNPEFVRGCLGVKFTIVNADISIEPSIMKAQYDFFLLQIFLQKLTHQISNLHII